MTSKSAFEETSGWFSSRKPQGFKALNLSLDYTELKTMEGATKVVYRQLQLFQSEGETAFIPKSVTRAKT